MISPFPILLIVAQQLIYTLSQGCHTLQFDGKRSGIALSVRIKWKW